MKNQILLLLLIFFSHSLFSQNITGNVKLQEVHNEHNHEKNLFGVTIQWANTKIGTATDANGNFSIDKTEQSNILVVSYIGFKTDSIFISNQTELSVILEEDNTLEEVVIEKTQNGSYTSKDENLYVKKITTAGLKKLPCCNLSESFENSADVDVSFSDAISGAKQIQMLGLAGVYSQILVENIPTIRGMASTYGLAFIPGPWMESIQISKGTATVINGYESTTGQINIELKKPNNSEKFYLNLFGNSMGRMELNSNASVKFNDKLSTMFLLHGSISPFSFDINNDGFADQPQTEQLNIINRWKFSNNNGMESQLGFKAMIENRSGGQMKYLDTENSSDYYGIAVSTNRYEAFYKLGSTINFMNEASVGSTFSLIYHNQNSFYGRNKYSGLEKSFYGNIIFDKELFSHEHKLDIGTSLLIDDYSEILNETNYNRNEFVPGVFAQYTYEKHEKFSTIIGYRADFHNIYGVFHTFRSHLKYHFNETTTIRASAGKGYRVANIFAENIGILASSREFVVLEDLKPEHACNYGMSFTKDFKISSRQKISWGVDFYRTDFENQVIVDIDADINQARIYNLNGKSYSNSFQTDLNIDVFRGLNIYTAARYNDVKTTMHNDFIDKPMVSKFKGLISISYSTKKEKWIFDVTNQFVGKSKLPSTIQNPAEYQLTEYSPSFYQLHAQITRKFKNFEIYVGGENLTNYTQKSPILASDEPFGNFFDSSIIWGPIIGRRIYGGLRFLIK
ncbi:MAG: TonB-dependent receptor [Bacteroidales bacterium]|nr:TonB-dependent receptor [Bacteroidales bacterium]